MEQGYDEEDEVRVYEHKRMYLNQCLFNFSFQYF